MIRFSLSTESRPDSNWLATKLAHNPNWLAANLDAIAATSLDGGQVASQPRYPRPLLVRYPDLAVKLDFLLAIRRMAAMQRSVLYFQIHTVGVPQLFWEAQCRKTI
jgi:hypothetical protein